MQRSKSLISQALSTLKGNMERTGDPLGFKERLLDRLDRGS